MGRNSVSSKTNNRKLHSADGNQKYQIIKSIDEGGQTSQVYLAKDESGQLVALLESEVKSLARLNNSHMVRILNHGQDGRFYDCKKTK